MKSEKKSSRGKKAKSAAPAPAAEKYAEETLGQDLFNEEPETQTAEIDIDDLLG